MDEKEGVRMEDVYVLKDEEATIHMATDASLWIKGPNDKKVQIISTEDGLAIYP